MAYVHPDFAHIPERRSQTGPVTRCVQYLLCSCGATIEFHKGRVRNPPDIIAKKAARKGWEADMKAGKHLCPSCVQGLTDHNT